MKTDWRMIDRKSEREFASLRAEIARFCPKFWAQVSAKRYLVPAYRQADYFNQEFLDTIMAASVVTYCQGAYGPVPDEILRGMYLMSVTALAEERPIYFLERELGEALIRTVLPLDLSADDIRWRRRTMRIMLPRGLMSLERNGVSAEPMYLDIGRAIKDELNALPVDLVREIQAYNLTRSGTFLREIPMPVFSRSGMIVTTHLSRFFQTDTIPGEGYATIRPFEGASLREVARFERHFETGVLLDATDDAFMNRLQHLALNILLFMGSVPLEYDPTEKEGPIRKMEILKDRVRPGLWPAKFVGRSQYRPSAKTTYHTASWSGRKLPQHWRAGHWKRVVHGTGRIERKLVWIEPYQTYGPQDEKTQTQAAH